MESGGGGGFWPYTNFQNPLPPFPPSMDDQRNGGISFPGNFSSAFNGGTNNANSHADAAVSWLSLPDVDFGNRSFTHGLVAASWVQENALGSHQETRKRVKENEDSSNSIAFIKGQWTEEEDRLLVRLVNQFGERRWSVIAAKIVGRAGKQCRERWHNHLRPDIKKDCWSEEEERLLVEVHEQLGNRWSEIAKRIPGRSENAIKNHWNATKRRQFSKRRVRSQDGGINGNKRKSVILQNYIKYKYFSGLTLGTPGSVIPENPSIQRINDGQLSEFADDQDRRDCPSLLAETYDEEMSFMQSLFGNSSSSSTVVNNGSQNNTNNDLGVFGRRSSARTNEDGVEEDSWSTYLASDPNLYEMGVDQINSTPQAAAANSINPAGYLSYLLDGSTGSHHGVMGMMNRWCSSASTAAAMDMDLMELVSASSHFSYGYGSCTKNPRPMF